VASALTNPSERTAAIDRRLAWVVAGFFCLVLFAPWLAFLVGVRGEPVENRPLAPWPEPGDGFFDELALALQDRLPLRAEAVRAQTAVALDFFGDSPSDSVLLGRDGWLFYARDFEAACATLSEVDAQAAGVARIAAEMGRAGKRFAFALAPDKSGVMRDLWSRRMERLPQATCAEQRRARLREALATRRDPALLDLWTPLERARRQSDEDVYLRLDTHWSDRGAAIAVERLLEALRPGLWNPEALRPESAAAATGDLSTLIGRPATEETRPLTVVRTGDRTAGEEVSLADGTKQLVFRTSGPNPRLGKAVLLYDSFFQRTTRLLPPFFDEIRYFRDDVRESDGLLAALADADVVIFTSAERSFYGNGWWRMPETLLRLRGALQGKTQRSGAPTP
jgi:alginate O-acetyltransferase complex protein AlgJ